jgi:hypothetical protein
MRGDEDKPGKAERLSVWDQPIYGAPDATSEVSRLDGFYRAECLTVFGACRCGESEGAWPLAQAA